MSPEKNEVGITQQDARIEQLVEQALARGPRAFAEEGALDRLLAEGVDRTVVVVSHSVTIRAAIGVTLGAPSAVWASVRVAPASLSIVRLWEDGQREVAVVGMPTDV